jgi:hypothetical protein
MPGGFRGLLDLVGPSVAGAAAPAASAPTLRAHPQRQSGTVPSLVSGPERREHISRRSGEANTQDLAYGWSEPQDGTRVGKQNAVWAFLNVSAGAGTYDVLHALPSKPVGVELWELRYPQGAAPVPHATIQHVRQSEWTESMVKINIVVSVGVLTGCTAVLIVKGT